MNLLLKGVPPAMAAKEVITRKASDNKYLHKDFHGALSAGIEYLYKNHGPQAVRDYLRRFSLTFYAPLRKALKQRGLIALKEHFQNIYRIEEASVEISFSDDEMILKVPACPAVTHMREHGYYVARLFHETVKTVNETLCEGTPFAAELVEYNAENGRSVQRFYRRPQ